MLVASNPNLSQSAKHKENRHHCVPKVGTWKVNYGPKAVTPELHGSIEESLLARKGHSRVLTSFLLSLIPLKWYNRMLFFPAEDFPNENKEAETTLSIVEKGSGP